MTSFENLQMISFLIHFRCTKHQTPTEQVVTSLENVNASLILPTGNKLKIL